MRALCVFLSCPLRDGHGQVGGMKEGNRARQQTKLPLETGPKLRTQQFLPSLFCTHNDNDKSDLIYPALSISIVSSMLTPRSLTH